ncbi:vacuolar membrane protein-domain-containing protein [Xylaria sp. CBS 124048]|nr:vacuolar membrane protein-domain-containing protein [Xylaria sp. CBS 124048]
MPIPFTFDVSVATSTATIGVDRLLPPTAMASIITATTSAATAAATLAFAATGGNDGNGEGGGTGGEGEGEGECRLLGPFALLVQLALGGLALLSLVYKRWRERPQRPLKIWYFDVSKQVFGSVLVHIANIFMSMLTSGGFSVKLGPSAVQTAAKLLRKETIPYVPNPCSFYLLNLAIDTTLGIPILIVLLRVITGLVAYTPWGKPRESIQSGNYGDPPKVWWWLKQSVIYFCGLFGMKFCVLLIFVILPWISRVGDWALGWTEGNERLQIVFVMMLFPLIMNALQYYIIDSFIKLQEPGHERVPQEEVEGRDSFNDDFGDDGYNESNGEENGEIGGMLRSTGLRDTGKKGRRNDPEEYDPDIDGQTVIGSRSSQEERLKAQRLTELAPHE